MWVWLVDSWTLGHSWTCSIPTLVPIPFHQWVIPTFLEIKKKLNVLVCLLFWWPLATWNDSSLPPPASTLILTSLQFCVFSIPPQAHSQKQSGKQQFEALPQCLSLSHSIRRLGAILSMITLFIKVKCILYLIEELHDVHTDNSGKKSPVVYNNTVLTEISKES